MQFKVYKVAGLPTAKEVTAGKPGAVFNEAAGAVRWATIQQSFSYGPRFRVYRFDGGVITEWYETRPGRV